MDEVFVALLQEAKRVDDDRRFEVIELEDRREHRPVEGAKIGPLGGNRSALSRRDIVGPEGSAQGAGTECTCNEPTSVRLHRSRPLLLVGR